MQTTGHPPQTFSAKISTKTLISKGSLTHVMATWRVVTAAMLATHQTA